MATAGIAQRWASQKIQLLDRDDTTKDEIVRLSKEFGVMSRHTSFLVLESEEAYRRFKIKRRQRKPVAQTAAPQVSGGDLESLSARRANLTPDDFQPGDPEVRVPAPANARSVVVVFPFGETKQARYEAGLGVWTARFLVSKDTPSGKYQVLVRVTHADGAVELLQLPFVVDAESPSVDVTIRKDPGQPETYEIRATQVIQELDLVRIIPADLGKERYELLRARKSSRTGRAARILKDAHRVEVRFPENKTRRLQPVRPGEFRGVWKPSAPLLEPVTLRFVVTDHASNPRTFDVRLDPDLGPEWSWRNGERSQDASTRREIRETGQKPASEFSEGTRRRGQLGPGQRRSPTGERPQ